MSTTTRKSRKRTRTQKSRSKSPTEITIGNNGTDYISTELPNKIHLLPNAPLDKKIFKIEYDLDDGSKCINYIDDANKHVIFKNKHGNYVLFNIYGESVDQEVLALCKSKLKSKSKRQKTAHHSLAKDVIMLESCKKEIDLTVAQQKLEELNVELSKKCPNLTMRLAPFYEYAEPMHRYGEHTHVCLGCGFYENIILALCNDSECISTIELLIEPSRTIRINSKTDHKQEGKKYNKLLRTVLSIVADEIAEVDKIRSVATNPVSAWLLIKYSNAIIETGHPFEKYLKENDKTIENVDKEMINSYYATRGGPIDLIVPITSENALKSQKDFDKIISSEIKC